MVPLTITSAQAHEGYDYLIGVHAYDAGNDACFTETVPGSTTITAKVNCIAARKIEAAAASLAEGHQCVIHTHGVVRGFFRTSTEGEFVFEVQGAGPSVNAVRIRRSEATENPNCLRPVRS